MKVNGSYKVAKWQEAPFDEISPNSRLTRASVEYECSGGIEGKAAVEYLMFYSHFDAKDQHNSSATYVGLIRFEGKINGKRGGMVLRDNGAFQGGTASSELQIAAGSGSGELKGITGKGIYRADRNGCSIELSYDVRPESGS